MDKCYKCGEEIMFFDRSCPKCGEPIIRTRYAKITKEVTSLGVIGLVLGIMGLVLYLLPFGLLAFIFGLAVKKYDSLGTVAIVLGLLGIIYGIYINIIPLIFL